MYISLKATLGLLVFPFLVVNHLLEANLVYLTNSGKTEEDCAVGGFVCKNTLTTRHMRHTVRVLIREPILQDKSEMEGRFEREGGEGGGREDEQ